MEARVKAFCKRLGIKYCDELISYYIKGEFLFEELGSEILNTERLICLNNEYFIFRKFLKEILVAADMIKQDKDLLLHICILIVIIRDDADDSILEMPDRERIDTDFTPLFAFLFFLEDMIQNMKKRGIPHQIISDTLNGLESDMYDYLDMIGRPGMRCYVGWYRLWPRGKIIRVGRLQFEMKTLVSKIRVYQKENDIKILIDGEYMHPRGMIWGSEGQDNAEEKYFAEITENGDCVSGYAVNEFGECVKQKVTLRGYEEKVRTGDQVISVHIPSKEPFSSELCEAAYVEAAQIFEQCYPEYKYKCFTCYSWMMEKRLKEIMGKDTNITLFAEKYNAFPILCQRSPVYSFLYHLPEPVSAVELPEKNSMQKAVKRYICNGNYFYGKGGLFLKP